MARGGMENGGQQYMGKGLKCGKYAVCLADFIAGGVPRATTPKLHRPFVGATCGVFL